MTYYNGEFIDTCLDHYGKFRVVIDYEIYDDEVDWPEAFTDTYCFDSREDAVAKYQELVNDAPNIGENVMVCLEEKKFNFVTTCDEWQEIEQAGYVWKEASS